MFPLLHREESGLLFMAQRDGREVVFVWDRERRCSAILVDGQLVGSVTPALLGDRVSTGIAKTVDPVWLARAIEDLLAGVEPFRSMITGPERDATADERSLSTPQPSTARSQLEIYASAAAWASCTGRQLSGLHCPLCGHPMIVTAPADANERLACPLCARALQVSVAMSITMTVTSMREALDLADEALPSATRNALTGGFEQLERLEQALSGPGSEE
jgi:hypothetical protein